MEIMVANGKYNELRKYLERANKQVDKLNGLVSDLLDITKLNAGKLPFTKSSFKVEDLIRDCVDQNQAISSHRIHVKGNLDLLIEGDKNRLEQVVCNLLTNAIKYSPGKDLVIIESIDMEDKIKIKVTDAGIGIAADNIPYVFDRFFRSENVETKFFGLGLGLYISSEIIKRHGGEIGVESEIGKGSTFWFVIPKSGVKF
jgi:signal transduction histidine kinase